MRLVEPWLAGAVEVRAWQGIPDRLAQLGLSAEDAMTQLWYASPNGLLSGGAAAVNAALHWVWWLRPLTWLYRLPGLARLEEWVYRWVAANRYRLPGSTPSCDVPPVDHITPQKRQPNPDQSHLA